MSQPLELIVYKKFLNNSTFITEKLEKVKSKLGKNINSELAFMLSINYRNSTGGNIFSQSYVASCTSAIPFPLIHLNNLICIHNVKYYLRLSGLTLKIGSIF